MGVRISWLILAIKFSFICADSRTFFSEICSCLMSKPCLRMILIMYQNNIAPPANTDNINRLINNCAFLLLFSIVSMACAKCFLRVLSILCISVTIESVNLELLWLANIFSAASLPFALNTSSTFLSYSSLCCTNVSSSSIYLAELSSSVIFCNLLRFVWVASTFFSSPLK